MFVASVFVHCVVDSAVAASAKPLWISVTASAASADAVIELAAKSPAVITPA
jgi:hypothetical protein